MSGNFSEGLRLALSIKRSADIELLNLQRDVREGKRDYSVSAVIAALENCDDALAAAWLAVHHDLRHAAATPAFTEATLSRLGAQDPTASASPLYGKSLDFAIIAITQKRIQQFFAKSPEGAQPQKNIV